MALCGGLFLWMSTSLNAASDDLQSQVLATPPTRMPQVTRAAIVQPLPPPPAPAEPTVLDRLRASLQPDIDDRRSACLGTAATPIVRIAGRAMFAPESAVVQSASRPLLERIGAALKNESGSLQVIGYTDNQPIRTVRFPSNFQLSMARAEAVRTIIARDLGDPARVSAEGRADADPIAANTHRRRPRAEPADRDRAASPGLTFSDAGGKLLSSRWSISFVGTALLAGLVWFFAPLLPGLEDWPPRLALIAVTAAGLGRWQRLLDLRRLQRDAALARGITVADDTDQTEEAQALRDEADDRA